MICPNPNCRKENPDDSVFCEYCGTRLSANPEPPVEDKSTCPNCGSVIGNVKFCPSCGADLRYKPVPSDNSDNFKRFVYAYISHDESGLKETPACVHYYNAFSKFKNNQWRLSWNWAAFFLHGFNMIYRSFYILGAFFLIVFGYLYTGIIYTTVDTEFDTLLIILILFFIISTVCGVFADFLYYKRFLSKMKKAINKYPKDIDSQCKFMARPWLYKR